MTSVLFHLIDLVSRGFTRAPLFLHMICAVPRMRCECRASLYVISTLAIIMFRPSRAWANDGFEAYRLATASNVHMHVHALPKNVLVHNVHAAATVGYKELKAQSAQKPLAAVNNAVAYVASDGSVVQANLHESVASFQVHENPCADAWNGAERMPSVVALDPSTWIVSGMGSSIFVIEEQAQYMIHIPDIPDSEKESRQNRAANLPWYVFQAEAASDHVLFLLQRAFRLRDTHQTGFDIIRVAVCDRQAEILWHVTCAQPIMYAHCHGRQALLGAEVPVSTTDDTGSAPRVPPYTWKQDGQSVTVTFTLPLSVQKQQMHVSLSQQGFRVSLEAPEARIISLDECTSLEPQIVAEESLRRGLYEACTLWAPIHPDDSTWTWEPHAQHHVLALHLAKAHPGTRWPSVFSDDDGVSETLASSELIPMLDRTNKYTSSSLLQDGLEDEDWQNGTSWVISYVDANGLVSQAKDQATFLASSVSKSCLGIDPAILLKYDVDGHVFVPPRAPLSLDAWTHTETVPAISYVLASKRDAHPVCMYRNGLATWLIVIESRPYSAPKHSSSLIYIYGAPGSQRADHASLAPAALAEAVRRNEPPASGLCRVLSIDAGPILDVVVLPNQGERMVCLCESSLLIIDGAFLL